jgi:hypothetical protein
MSEPHDDLRFTTAAWRLWLRIPEPIQRRLLDNVWCTACRQVTTMVDYHGQVVEGDLILTGICATCGITVVRQVELEQTP